MNDTELHPIADAARRSGLSVSAVRFYANEGLVAPAAQNSAGHRLYTIEAIARLELVRTLRDVDTDLAQIRRLLEGETTLHQLLTTHLAIVENQERAFRARRAVLGTLIKQGGTTARADLMHRLVTMTDEEREQAIDDFWNEIARDLDVPEGFVDRLRKLRPRLPEEPTAEQLQAWIELGDLVGDPLFREEVRTYLHQTYGADDVGRKMAQAPTQELIHESGPPFTQEILSAYHAGQDPRSPSAQEAITRFLEVVADHTGRPPTPELRNRMAEGYRRLPDILRQIKEEDAAAQDPVHDNTHGRYQALVGLINGDEPEIEIDDEPQLPGWMADALSVCTPTS
ncbi:MerR family transcriptional regulator [Nocardiopsis sp. JB363]|uniref:helix-turn-helix domain-containing protein n=1 Tax=Nocardiopsis sp. JB363 TaxID=1434837 RepID=UPI00097B2DBB|nr:MerR family transcriptional regulator [Nocardiopsis sp. JB363]SIO88575.1 Possible regulator [Nocardiopsis sp. JB363]